MPTERSIHDKFRRRRARACGGRDWRCACGALLGIWRGEALHLSYRSGVDYLVRPPVTAICGKCGTPNVAAVPPSGSGPSDAA